ALASLDEPGNRSANPEQMQDFPFETRMYYIFTLQPSLAWPERDRIRQAEGKWPDLARVLWELSQKHGVAKVPPGQWEGPRSLQSLKDDDLPKELKELKRGPGFRSKPQDSGRPDPKQKK